MTGASLDFNHRPKPPTAAEAINDLIDADTGKPGALIAALIAQGKAVLAIDAFLLGEHGLPDTGFVREKPRVGAFSFLDTFQPTDTANRVQEASAAAMQAAVASMTTLNKAAAACCRRYPVHACTDVTGFGFLGHLHEMMDGRLSCRIYAAQVPLIPEALEYADAFLLTAAGQRNRNHAGPFVQFEEISFAMEEVLFDPQTSGGLLVALPEAEAGALLADLQALGLPAAIVGEITERKPIEILVTQDAL